MHSHLAKMVGGYIFETRSKKKILQYELAKKLKMTGQFLGRIEKGDVMIPETALLRAINILSLKDETIVKIFKTAAELEAKDLVASSKTSSFKKAADAD